jgi:Ca-activated chloride channel family protein
MFFLWPHYLWLMLAIPLLPAAYVWLLRRRGKQAVRYSSLVVVRAASAGRNWRRHVPPALLLLACAGLFLAAARPMARVPLPWARSSIMLAMDVSLSMRVTDVQPNRLAAAQDAAKLFLRDLPKDIEVGLVTFAGSTQVAQRATLDRSSLVAAIDGFQMQMGTAVGNAIVMSLAELFPDHGLDVGEMTFGSKRQGRSLDQPKVVPVQITPVAPGSYTSAAIILLSDGRRTTGIDTLEAAKMAADRGVRIYVVGLGTVDGEAATIGRSGRIHPSLDSMTTPRLQPEQGPAVAGAFQHSTPRDATLMRAVLALGVGGFSIGTGEFVIMGLLPEVAQDMGVSIPQAGHVISAYALGVVIGAPALAVLAAGWGRRALLIALMAAYALANFASALAPGYLSLNVLRFLSGLPHGTYFGVAALVAASLAPPGRRASAVGMVMLGLTGPRWPACRSPRRWASTSAGAPPSSSSARSRCWPSCCCAWACRTCPPHTARGNPPGRRCRPGSAAAPPRSCCRPCRSACRP